MAIATTSAINHHQFANHPETASNSMSSMVIPSLSIREMTVNNVRRTPSNGPDHELEPL